MINKSIVYFPYINLNPRKQWYKRAILYWDHIEILTHQFNQKNVPFTGDTFYLYEKGLIRAMHITKHINPALYDSFLKSVLMQESSKSFMNCYKGKFDNQILEELKKHNLAIENDNELLVEKNCAKLYLSLVCIDEENLKEKDLFTDSFSTLELLNYGRPINFSKKIARKENMNSICLDEMLPAPRENVSIQEIVEFKDKYYDNYLEYRNFIERKFSLLNDLDNLSDEQFLTIKLEIQEGIKDIMLSPLEKKFKDVCSVTIPIIDFFIKVPVFGTINRIHDALKEEKPRRFRYLGMVRSKLS